MSNQGWIKIHRKIEDSIIFSSEKGLKIWVWCLLRANHTEADFFIGRQKIHLKPGQFVTGKNVAKEQLKMAVATIWFWLDQLEVERSIERKSTNKYSVITVLNWNRYQDVEPKVERKRNADGTQIEQQMEPNNNVKNVKTDNTDNKIQIQSNKLLGMFELVNPSYERLFSNKTQRDSLKRMVDKYGEGWVVSAIKRLPTINAMPYAPQATTPYELEMKLGKIKAFLEQQKNKTKGGITQL